MQDYSFCSCCVRERYSSSVNSSIRAALASFSVSTFFFLFLRRLWTVGGRAEGVRKEGDKKGGTIIALLVSVKKKVFLRKSYKNDIIDNIYKRKTIASIR